jgi:hypothetical protein
MALHAWEVLREGPFSSFERCRSCGVYRSKSWSTSTGTIVLHGPYGGMQAVPEPADCVRVEAKKDECCLDFAPTSPHEKTCKACWRMCAQDEPREEPCTCKEP